MYLSSLKKRLIFYIVGVGGNAPPQPPFMTKSWLGRETGSPHPPRILRRVRLVRFFPR